MSIDETLNTRRRRIVWRACHRGMREMDLVLGRFVKRRIETMGDDELEEMERLIALPDTVLYGWIFKRHPLPAEYDTKLMTALMGMSGVLS
ncbi:MAG: succinate dehydrogenase assembly factor 2 [Hyphomicrobiales bacterium]